MSRVRPRRIVGAVCAVWVAVSVSVAAQDQHDSLDRRFDAVERKLAAAQAEIKELSMFLRAAIPSPIEEIQPLQLNLDVAQAKGSPDASIVLVEFSDFECPFCAQHFRATYPQVIEKFVDTGQVSYVFKNLPLQTLHPRAIAAAEAAQCAGEQKKFWQMHDKLFENQKTLSEANIRSHAQQIGLNVQEYDECIAEGVVASRVNEDLAEAKQLGLTGTPSFLLGKRAGAKVMFTHKITGAQQFHVFEAALRSLQAK